MFVSDDPLRPDPPTPTSSEDESEEDDVPGTNDVINNYDDHPVFKVPNGTEADRKHGQKFNTIFLLGIIYLNIL